MAQHSTKFQNLKPKPTFLSLPGTLPVKIITTAPMAKRATLRLKRITQIRNKIVMSFGFKVKQI